MLGSLGLITVPTPGTPVRVTSSSIVAISVYFQVPVTIAGRVFIGLAGLNRDTFQNVVRVLSNIPTDTWTLQAGQASMFFLGIDLADIWVDVETANSGVLVSYLKP